jgi:N utilization substance protein A
MDYTAFSAAVNEIAESKGLSTDAVVTALKEALERAYIKYLGGGDDAIVKVEIDPTKNTILVAQMKKVVKDVQDDYLEISLEDANKGLKEPAWKEGDSYPIPCSVDDLNKVFAMAVKNNLRQRLAEAERVALYDVYKDHIGEMVTGTVEKADDRSVSVNIGRTVVELGRREMIGDEYFKVGDPIKVYIQEVKQANEEGKPAHGPQIEVTRSSEGFLKRLFEEEIHEIFDGTVLIKGIAREAGVRSKVAVASINEDVDATGACIGQGGSRIQKIVSQLGNGKDKEKIDIIAWSANPGLYIAESLRPAQVLGVAIGDPSALPHPTATAVVRDDQLSLAIGKKGANARLANKLTGWSIDIVEESVAKSDNLVYVTMEDLQKQADEEKKVAERAAYAKKSQEEALKKEATLKAEEEAVANQTGAVTKGTTLEQEGTPEETPVAPVAAEVAPTPVAPTAPVAETPVAATPVTPVETPAPVKEAPVTPTEVKTTTTIADLEKELEEAKNRPAPVSPFHHGFQKNKRPHKITEEEVEHVKPSEVAPSGDAMPIYSQEELDQIAQEESEKDDTSDKDSNGNNDDVDIDQYDKYYDDGDK